MTFWGHKFTFLDCSFYNGYSRCFRKTLTTFNRLENAWSSIFKHSASTFVTGCKIQTPIPLVLYPGDHLSVYYRVTLIDRQFIQFTKDILIQYFPPNKHSNKSTQCLPIAIPFTILNLYFWIQCVSPSVLSIVGGLMRQSWNIFLSKAILMPGSKMETVRTNWG